jgi:hypothetical protein
LLILSVFASENKVDFFKFKFQILSDKLERL